MTTITLDVLENVSTVYRQERSASSTALDELKSGLQKYIRRNMVHEAQRCGSELYAFLYVPDGARMVTNFIHRLMIIYLEDVGLAGLSVWCKIDVLIDKIAERSINKEDNSIVVRDRIEDEIWGIDRKYILSTEQVLMYLIEFLCKLPKSRTLSHYHSVFIQTDKDILPLIERDMPEIQEKRVAARSWSIYPNPEGVVFSEMWKAVEHEKMEIRNGMIGLASAIVRGDGDMAYDCLLSLLAEDEVKRCTLLPYEDRGITGMKKSYSNAVYTPIISSICYAMKVMGIKQTGFTWSGKDSKYIESNFIIVLRKWCKELDKVREYDLPLRLGILGLCYLKENKITSYKEHNRIDLVSSAEKVFASLGEELELHDYCVDMHTKRGKRGGKGRSEFANEGSFVTNEDKKVIVEKYLIIYNRFKYSSSGMSVDEIYEQTSKCSKSSKSNKSNKSKLVTPVRNDNKKESEVFSPICRVQLTCSKSRPCTYLAKKKKGGNTIYFVKGPYKTKESVRIPIVLADIKKECCSEELPSMEYSVETLLPDLFPNVPLGIRKDIDRNKPAYFLVTRSLLQGDIPTIKKSSKLWTLENVIDWNKVEMVTSFSFDIGYIKDYTLGLIWRHIIGIPDPADRNFIIDRDGKFYSVDEENINNPTDYSNTLKGGRKESVRKYIEDNWEELGKILEVWEEKLDKCKLLERIEMLPILDRLSKFIEDEKYREKLFS